MHDQLSSTAPCGGRATALPPAARLLLWLLLVWSLAVRLAFGAIDPGPDRFWDERYSLHNIRHILDHGKLEPVNGWYPVPSYLPHAALLAISRGLHELTGIEALEVLEDAKFTPTGYILTRSLQAIFGTVAILLTFAIGRRVFDWRVGLLGALFLAAAPNHIRLSGFFKPDILLLMLGLVAVLLSLAAVAKPRLHRYLGVGMAIGLAASAKLTGVLYAVPLTIGTLFVGWRDRRAWLRLTAAGAASAATFFLLNPHWRLYLDYFGRLRSQYGEKAATASTGHLDVLVDSLRALLSTTYHGPILGILALAALALLPVVGSRSRNDAAASLASDQTARIMLASFPVAYLVVYAAMTTYPKSNHYLQVVPYTSLAAAWLVVGLWQRLRSALRWPQPMSTNVAVTAMALALVTPATAYVYRAAVPSTTAVLVSMLRPRLDPVALRVVYRESSAPALELRNFRNHGLTVTVDDLADVSTVDLDLADALIARRPRSRRPTDNPFVARMRDAEPGDSLAADSAPFVAHGPDLIALLQPWQLLAPVTRPLRARRSPDALTLITHLPDDLDTLGQGTPISLGLWLHRLDQPPTLRVGNDEVPMHSTRDGTRRDRYLTPRFFSPPSARVRIVLPADTELLEPPLLEVFVWRRGQVERP